MHGKREQQQEISGHQEDGASEEAIEEVHSAC